jgi:uncharacterized protein CbrC (UPF0167 family)
MTSPSSSSSSSWDVASGDTAVLTPYAFAGPQLQSCTSCISDGTAEHQTQLRSTGAHRDLDGQAPPRGLSTVLCCRSTPARRTAQPREASCATHTPTHAYTPTTHRTHLCVWCSVNGSASMKRSASRGSGLGSTPTGSVHGTRALVKSKSVRKGLARGSMALLDSLEVVGPEDSMVSARHPPVSGSRASQGTLAGVKSGAPGQQHQIDSGTAGSALASRSHLGLHAA